MATLTSYSRPPCSIQELLGLDKVVRGQQGRAAEADFNLQNVSFLRPVFFFWPP